MPAVSAPRQRHCRDYKLSRKYRMYFFTETKRKIDLTNLLNAIDDAMVKSGLILDDNRDIIAAHDGSRVFHDKFNPRIEVKNNRIK